MFRRSFPIALATVAVVCTSCSWAQSIEYLPGIEWPEPPVVEPGATNAAPPSDAIVLFDGSDLSAWEGAEGWKVEEGELIVGNGDIRTKQSFGDIQLHIEWSAPADAAGRGQGRGNSGVYLQDRYEVQVLDSYDNPTYPDGQASAVYKQQPPMVNAMRPPGEWNTYDIIWTAPRFNDDGSLKSPAYVTVLHNGVLTLNHYELAGFTFWHEPASYEPHGPGPIRLQDHGDPVRFRNIWVREFKPIEGRQVHKPRYRDHSTGGEWPADEAGE